MVYRTIGDLQILILRNTHDLLLDTNVSVRLFWQKNVGFIEESSNSKKTSFRSLSFTDKNSENSSEKSII